MRFAEKTSVSVEKSRAEIETILSRYGATKFGYATDGDRGLASITFEANQRLIRFVLTLPKKSDKVFQHPPQRHRTRSPEAIHAAWEQACRQRWRALALAIKAKLEAVECKISEFETEFMGHIVLPGGYTVGELMTPQIKEAYESGRVPDGIAGLLAGPK